MNFSATSAAMEGFRLVKNRPGTFLAWCAIYFVVNLVIYGAMFATVLPNMAAFQPGAGATQDPTMMMRTMMPFMLVMYPLLLVWSVLFYAAVYRAILRPEDKGFAYFKIGGDELRMFGVILILALMGIVYMALLFGAVYLLKTALGAGPGGLVGLLVGLVGYCAYIWAAIRLSLVLPQTLAEKRIDIVAAWRLTRGRFWKLVGMFLLTLLIVFAVAIGLYLIIAAVGVGAFAGMMGGGHPHLTAVSVILGLLAAVLLFVLALTLPTLMVVAIIAPAAAAYRELKGPRDVSGAFS